MKQQMQARMPAAAPLGNVAVSYRLNMTASSTAVATWQQARRWRGSEAGSSGSRAPAGQRRQKQRHLQGSVMPATGAAMQQQLSSNMQATGGSQSAWPARAIPPTHHACCHHGVAAEQQGAAPSAVHQPDGHKREGPQRAAHDGSVDQGGLGMGAEGGRSAEGDWEARPGGASSRLACMGGRALLHCQHERGACTLQSPPCQPQHPPTSSPAPKLDSMTGT